jgi:hypothetical protein
MLEHQSRGLALGKASRWRLTPLGLEVEQTGRAPFTLPLGEVVAVHLAHDPTKYASNRYRCDLDCRDGSILSLLSRYETMTGATDGANSFRALIEALIPRIAAANPACRFYKGRRLRFVLLLGLTGPVVALTAFILGGIAGMGASDRLILVQAAFAIGLVVGAGNAYVRWPRPFPPERIPAGVLPAPS